MALQIGELRAILFDIDGTLSDSDDQLVEKVERLLRPFLFFLTGADRHKRVRGLVMALESPGNFIYSLADRFDLDSLFIRVLEARSRRRKNRLKPYRLIPGVGDALCVLQSRCKLGVVSARDEHTSRAFIEQFDLSGFFDVVVTSQTTRHTKPFPDSLLYAADQLGVAPKNCLMVGDTTVDMCAAKLAGMRAAGVLCGFGREKELLRAGADVILQSPVYLPALLGIPD